MTNVLLILVVILLALILAHTMAAEYERGELADPTPKMYPYFFAILACMAIVGSLAYLVFQYFKLL